MISLIIWPRSSEDPQMMLGLRWADGGSSDQKEGWISASSFGANCEPVRTNRGWSRSPYYRLISCPTTPLVFVNSPPPPHRFRKSEIFERIFEKEPTQPL